MSSQPAPEPTTSVLIFPEEGENVAPGLLPGSFLTPVDQAFLVLGLTPLLSSPVGPAPTRQPPCHPSNTKFVPTLGLRSLSAYNAGAPEGTRDCLFGPWCQKELPVTLREAAPPTPASCSPCLHSEHCDHPSPPPECKPRRGWNLVCLSYMCPEHTERGWSIAHV